MDLSSLRTLIGQTALIDVEACRRELEHIRRGRGLFDAREVEVLARLDERRMRTRSIVAPRLMKDVEVNVECWARS